MTDFGRGMFLGLAFSLMFWVVIASTALMVLQRACA